MSVSVIIPTYKRPVALEACIRSLLALERRPDEIVIVGRVSDTATEAKTAELKSSVAEHVRVLDAWVDVPGHMPPVELGVQTASGEVAVFIDDDVTVAPKWLEYLLRHFSDSRVAVVGGRVIVPGVPSPRLKGNPGQVSWYGKHWGNIASVAGTEPIEVASVMECNWAWRRSLLLSLEFDRVLNFDHASMYGMALCFQARQRGYKVIYDPQARVYHHVAPRTPELHRADRPRRTFGYCRNYTYIMLKHLPWWQAVAFLLWWFLIGERSGWGLGALIADAFERRRFGWDGTGGPALRGKIEGARIGVMRRLGRAFS